MLTVNQGGKERELSIDEALELQTYQAALAGSRMAIRKVLKMIEKRETFLRKKAPVATQKITTKAHYSSDNANEAMRILDLAQPSGGKDAQRLKLQAWATQAALSRSGRKPFEEREINNIKLFTRDSETLRWPRVRKQ